MVLVKKPIFSCFNSNIRFIGYQNAEVEPSEIPLQPLSTTRPKCPACYKQCKENEHIIEHMRTSHHSVHDPKCGVCNTNCKSFESLWEHIAGSLAKETVEMRRSADNQHKKSGSSHHRLCNAWRLLVTRTLCKVDAFCIAPFHTSSSLCARYEIIGIIEKNLPTDMPWEEVRERIRQILYSGEPTSRVLVGHNLETNLRFLELSYLDHLQR
ncbi:hypothetical protein H5410_047462 [Solanum commersonii]|uniref:C2H2-type domain-containing protein n=1 Tax=Solanum commersonii TaxID=4109 RepID=A0A9J5XIC5_SOLCO|nr:hypothetical protein H5410_047462 [Solanum commersonii]